MAKRLIIILITFLLLLIGVIYLVLTRCDKRFWRVRNASKFSSVQAALDDLPDFWEVRNASKFSSIQAALDDLPDSGGAVFVPAGTHTITSAITMKSNQALVGVGQSSIITTQTANIDLIRGYDVGSYSGIPGVLISNLHLIGKNSGTGNGIVIKNSHYTTISDLWIENVYNGIKFLGDAGDHTDNNMIINNHIFRTLKHGIYLYPSSGNIEDMIIQGNILNYCGGSGIYVNPGTRNTIIGNSIEECDSYGIFLGGSHRNTVTGNDCSENGKDGIYLKESSANIISNNVCCVNDYQDTGAYNGIQIYSNSGNNIIIGNSCTHNDRYGIYIVGADCNRNRIIANVVYSNGTGQIQDNGTDTDVAHN